MADDNGTPPGLSQGDTIAKLEGLVARYRFELNVYRRKLEELQPNGDLRGGQGSPAQSSTMSPMRLNENVQMGQRKDLVDVLTKIQDSLSLLRSELVTLRKKTKTNTASCYEELKGLRHALSSYLDPKFMFQELIKNSAKEAGYVLVREDHLVGLLRIITENVAGIAGDLVEAYPQTKKEDQ